MLPSLLCGFPIGCAAQKSAFSKSGFLPVGNFQNNGVFTSAAGLNSTFALYFAFSATGTPGTGMPIATPKGKFDALSYILYGYNGAAARLPPTSTIASRSITLATGGLVTGSKCGA